MRALRDMMKSGSGRSVLESQILQEASIERLLAIVRGDELPERPAPKAPEEPAPEIAAEAAATEEVAAEEVASEEAADEAAKEDEAA
jgi:hypothetical protein